MTKLAAIFSALMNLDEHQHKLYDTDHKTRDPDNNRNHCQSVQAFTSSYIKIWQKAKPPAPFWTAMFNSIAVLMQKILNGSVYFFVVSGFLCGFGRITGVWEFYCIIPDASQTQA